MSSRNPTLQEGAESEDGWVEYLQSLLSEYFFGRTDFRYYESDGRFDADTTKAVRRYQQEHHLVVDGIVGDQTWAALSGVAERQEAGTDGRDANTYVEHGMELRFDPGSATYYIDGSDQLALRVVNVGNQNVSGDGVTPVVHVRRPDGTSHEPSEFSTYHGYAYPGGWFEINVKDATGAGPAGRYAVIAQLPMATGGDVLQMEFERTSA